MSVDLELLESVFKLCQKYQISELEVGDIKLKKTIHLGPKLPKKKFTLPPSDDDIMFASSSAPKLSLADFAKFTSNPVKGPNE